MIEVVSLLTNEGYKQKDNKTHRSEYIADLFSNSSFAAFAELTTII